MSNNNFTKAKKAKCDEFYTQYADIEKELQYYNFEDKIVYCNCDHPIQSNFVKYFCDNYHKLKLKGLISTFYSEEGKSFVYRFDGLKESKKGLNGNGSYDSEECLKLLEECDVVVTNPPFSLFRKYVKLLMDYNKKFLVIGNQNAITYKDIFPYIKNNELWLGVHSCKTMEFSMPMSYESGVIVGNRKIGKVPSISWFTNIDHINPNKPLILTKTYNPIDYPHYDNYDAINVNKVKDIPIDYDGVMGVPITFLQYYNQGQFEIIGMASGIMGEELGVSANLTDTQCKEYFNKNKAFRKGFVCYTNNGKIIVPYMRILIKKNDSLKPVEFEIIGLAADKRYDDECFIKGNPTYLDDKHKQFMGMVLNGKATYARILIKKR